MLTVSAVFIEFAGANFAQNLQNLMMSWILKSNWVCRLRGNSLKKKFQMNQILMLLSEKVFKRH